MSMDSGLRRRILVVDDDRAILELVCTRLTLGGYDAFGARDGAEGLQRLSSLRPQAMILDLNMPNLDGFGVLKSLGRERAQATPTLVLTARHGTADVQRAIAMGARDYLAKPFKDANLLMRVARLFRPRAPVLSLDDSMAEMDRMLTQQPAATPGRV
jgi:two-component system OmpR family response regulator